MSTVQKEKSLGCHIRLDMTLVSFLKKNKNPLCLFIAYEFNLDEKLYSRILLHQEGSFYQSNMHPQAKKHH